MFSGDVVTSADSSAHRTSIHIRRRFQFSSALKRMSTVSTLPNGKLICSVKGAPETIQKMLDHVPDFYVETYKQFTRRGSRVLALGIKELDSLSMDKVIGFAWVLLGVLNI